MLAPDGAAGVESVPMFEQFLLSGFWVEPEVAGAVVVGAVVDGVALVWAIAAAPPPGRAPVRASPPAAIFIRSFM